MKVIVQKYGGSSLSSIDKIKKIAKKIVERKKQGYELVVVVSAMGKTTNKLLDMAHELSNSPDKRELDMLLSVGERQTISLLAISIKELGYEVLSLTGSQSGIITNTVHNNAKILEIRPYRIEDAIIEGKIVIVAGFQGVSYLKEVTTLGRGGSDTTALALTAALNAQICEIFSDVDGVYSSDPNKIKDAKLINEISYESMLELSENGAKVLASDALKFAKHYKIKLYSKNSFNNHKGTFITDKEVLKDVIAISNEKQILFIELEINKLQYFINFLLKNNINYQEIKIKNEKVFISFNKDNLHSSKLEEYINSNNIKIFKDWAKVSIIGNNLNKNTNILKTIIDIFKRENIKYYLIDINHIRINIILNQKDIEKSSNLLHKTFIN